MRPETARPRRTLSAGLSRSIRISFPMSVNGRTLIMRYDRQLDQTSVPAETAFVVLVNGGLRTVDAVAVRGDGGCAHPGRGGVGRQLRHRALRAAHRPIGGLPARHRRQPCIHVQGELAAGGRAGRPPRSSLQPLTASFSNVPSSHDGSGSFTFNIVFSEQVWIGTGFPRAQLLVVTGGTVTGAHWLIAAPAGGPSPSSPTAAGTS